MPVVDQLQKLAELRASGALTDDEFAREKAKLLGPDASPDTASSTAGIGTITVGRRRLRRPDVVAGILVALTLVAAAFGALVALREDDGEQVRNTSSAATDPSSAATPPEPAEARSRDYSKTTIDSYRKLGSDEKRALLVAWERTSGCTTCRAVPFEDLDVVSELETVFALLDRSADDGVRLTLAPPRAVPEEPATPAPVDDGFTPLTYSGNGTKNLPTITVPADAVLEWTNTGDMFSINANDYTDPDAALAMSVQSEDHSGTSHLPAGTYKKVIVLAFGTWTVKIRPA